MAYGNSNSIKNPKRDADGKLIQIPKIEDFVFDRWDELDPAKLQQRQWLYGQTYLEGALSATIANGGVGKSIQLLTEAISIALGKPLLGVKMKTRADDDPDWEKDWATPGYPVFYYNAEESLDEIKRRVAAICQHYGINPEKLTSVLEVLSGHDYPLIFGKSGNGEMTFHEKNLKHFEQAWTWAKVAIFDPFVSIHECPENDNTTIDAIIKRLGKMAALKTPDPDPEEEEEAARDQNFTCQSCGAKATSWAGQCEACGAWNTLSKGGLGKALTHRSEQMSVHIAHHTRKASGEIGEADARGASAVYDGVRALRYGNRMTQAEAQRFKIDDPSPYFRMNQGKANYSKLSSATEWYKHVSVILPNGDDVGVIERWTPPGQFDALTPDHKQQICDLIGGGEYRSNVQTGTAWVGNVVADVLDLDVQNEVDCEQVKGFVKKLFDDGVLKKAPRLDKKNRNKVLFVAPGDAAKK